MWVDPTPNSGPDLTEGVVLGTLPGGEVAYGVPTSPALEDQGVQGGRDSDTLLRRTCTPTSLGKQNPSSGTESHDPPGLTRRLRCRCRCTTPVVASDGDGVSGRGAPVAVQDPRGPYFSLSAAAIRPPV